MATDDRRRLVAERATDAAADLHAYGGTLQQDHLDRIVAVLREAAALLASSIPATEDRLRVLVAKWRERGCEYQSNPEYGPMAKADGATLQDCADELAALLASPVEAEPRLCTCWLGTAATYGSAKERQRCALHGDARVVETEGGAADPPPSPLETICRQCGHIADVAARYDPPADPPPSPLLDLLREVIGDDDPRTWEDDEQWQEILAGKGEFDHIETVVYAGTLRRILSAVRGPAAPDPSQEEGRTAQGHAPHAGTAPEGEP